MESKIDSSQLQNLVDYMSNVSSMTIDVDKDILYKELSKDENLDKLKQFTTNDTSNLISITQLDTDSSSEGDKDENVKLIVDSSFEYRNEPCQTIIFMKKGTNVDCSSKTKIKKNLQLLNFTSDGQDKSVFNSMQNYVQSAMTKIFTSYKHKIETDINPAAKVKLESFKPVEEKLNELSALINQAQKNEAIKPIILEQLPGLKSILTELKKKLGKDPTVEEAVKVVNERKDIDVGNINDRIALWESVISPLTLPVKRHKIQFNYCIDEINYWRDLLAVLKNAKEQIESKDIQMALSISQASNSTSKNIQRFQANTNLDANIKGAYNIYCLLKEMPIVQLMTTTKISEIEIHIKKIFDIFISKMKNTDEYPITRMFYFIKILSKDLNDHLIEIFGNKLLSMDYNKFYDLYESTKNLFNECWDKEYERLQKESKVLQKSRNETLLTKEESGDFEHTKLFKRLKDIKKFRKEHENLIEITKSLTIDETNPDVESPLIRQIKLNYNQIDESNLLDLTTEGQKSWIDKKNKNFDENQKIENEIARSLTEQLSAAQNAHQLFNIFKKFQKVLTSKSVQSAISEYQTKYYKYIVQNVEELKAKYLKGYRQSSAFIMNKVKGIPEKPGTIIWQQQFARKVNVYLENLKIVLGEQWEKQIDKKEFYDKCVAFTKMTTPDISVLGTEIFQNNFELYKEKVIAIVARQSGYELKVNFDDKSIDTYKEQKFIKNLYTSGSSIYTCTSNLADFKKSYPYAISLDDSFKTFNNIIRQIKNDSDINKLIAQQKNEIHGLIKKNIDLCFNNFNRLEKFNKDFTELIVKLNQTVRNLIDYNSRINTILGQIEKCEMNKEIIAQKIKEIQNIIDNVIGCSNVKIWIKGIDLKLENILTKKLEEIISTWINEFNAPKPINEPILLKEVSIHSIKMIDQIICVEPNLNEARKIWYNDFHDVISIICSNERLRYRLENSTLNNESENTYKNIILKISPSILENSYKTLEDAIEASEKYVNHWLSYQVLWNLQPESIYGKVGEDMEKWQELMNDVKIERRTFDNNETEKVFGSIVINYSAVQTKIINKYDTFHKEIISKFANQTNDALKTFYQTISDARVVLENNSVDNVNTDIVEFITEVQEVKNKCKTWEEEMNKYKNSKKILDKQRYHYPPSFTNMDQVESEWSKFRQILEKKSKSMNEQIPVIQGRISDESQKIDKKIKELESYWNKNKPYKIDNPSEALKILNITNTMLKNVKNDYTKNCKAKELLEMEYSDPNRLDGIEEDLNDLKEVWTGLNNIFIKVDNLKETPFAAVQADKIKINIDDALKEMSALPPKMRTYDAYECVENKLQKLKKENLIIADLRSPAIKERHWKSLKEIMKIKKDENEFILEDFWNIDLLKLEKKLRDIIDTATGELILENFIKKSKETWTNFEIELVQYKQKCKLIKGWDDMFTKLDEDINMFQSMSNSPHYGIFKDDIEPWKEKLEKARLIFNEWVDVQRRWVYLEGIFFGSSDIMNDLATDYNKFKAIDNEFTTLMKKVTSKPFILPVISIPNIKSVLEEKLKKSLERIQKALNTFLDKQRQNFARFYFIGDEDLLEIIGNSKIVSKITRHFNKMFAGMNSLLTKDNDGNELIAMVSREQEIVNFESSIKISDDPVIYKWLGKVQSQMQITLATKLEKAVLEISQMDYINQVDSFIKWIEKYPAQITVLSSQVLWSASIESALKKEKLLNALPDNFTLQNEEDVINNMLSALSDQVLKDLKVDMRKKLEQLITELVHQRDVVRLLIQKNVINTNDFDWLYYMRFYFNPKTQDVLKRLQIKMSNAPFDYGFEYLGVAEKLIQTPLTDRCYLTLTQGLNFKFGGAPFGPAGTGKTESVKALGGQLGRFVLVFNCDEKFDFNSMKRIFVGLCQVGAWGCFDEFNRLEERILSAVSQQILIIQTGLKESSTQIDLMGKIIKLNHQMGIFITMNPGYAGRSQLPDNLKQLFRQMAMIKPDRDMIAQVTLFSQGYKTAERLSSKMVSLFELCGNQLSSQPHYDFGLRALKSVLVNAGNLKRQEEKKRQENKNNENINIEKWEQDILLKSVCNTIIPKLVKEDLTLFQSLLIGVFPDAHIEEVSVEELKNKLIELCKIRNLLPEESFISKILQLYSIQNMNRLMLVGNTGTGKSAALSLLFEALQSITKKKGEKYIIDPKAVNKDILYGTLDPTTLDWTDGVFTGILRKILDNQRGEMDKLHWIIFDGDVDPEWAENLNSVLDDNKLLTLPNGDRLSIPPNVRIMFEVESLKYATLATVSRCGMIWFSDSVVSIDMMYEHYLKRLQQEKYEDAYNYSDGGSNDQMFKNENSNEDLNAKVRKKAVDSIRPFFDKDGFVTEALKYVEKLPHIMDFTIMRALNGMFALLRKGILNILDYNDSHSSFPMEDGGIISCMHKWLIISLIWGFGGDLNLKHRTEFSNKLKDFTSEITFPSDSNFDMIDYGLKYEDQSWETFKSRVPNVDLDSSKVSNADLVITTVDTVRHQEILCSWISQCGTPILCGPPGSGKTMTLMATLKVLTDVDMIFINFSSSTTPELVLKTFDQYCEYVKSSNGIILRPKQVNQKLIVFCDEINLPETDKYSTQVVITFLRELLEHNGFWRPSDKQWIKLEKIQFVGACNPPTDVGRHPMNNRFLRHCPLLYVDFPGKDSLKQIYGTFNKAILNKTNAELRAYADPLTDAMVEFYTRCQLHYTPDIQPHYIYSPRELTRWKHAINESVENCSNVNDLCRLWAHEALRLFQDRLVLQEEKEWCDKLVDEIGNQYFIGISPEALQRPILFTDLINKTYVSCNREDLLNNIEGKLKVFYEEELNVPLVIFDSVLEHILRIDRVLKQPIGHLLLCGNESVGKTSLSRFVAWLNNLTFFQIKAGRNYSVNDFDADLRSIMKRSGCKGEKICFIFDGSNVLGPAFLERMNALLAGGEVPGLFEGDEYTSLISTAKEHLSKEIKGLDTEEEIYKAFVKGVQRNLHVVFTMNPLAPDFSSRAASSPALYNRCVIDWFGDWSRDGLIQVANKLTEHVEVNPENFNKPGINEITEMRELLVNSITDYHIVIKDLNNRLQKATKKFNYISPRDFLDFMKHMEKVQREKSDELSEQQNHIKKGLDKIRETEESVRILRESLVKAGKELELKKKEADEKMENIIQEEKKCDKMKEEVTAKEKLIGEKQIVIEDKKEKIEKELSTAMPRLEKARNDVASIKGDKFSELKTIKKETDKNRRIIIVLGMFFEYLSNLNNDKKSKQSNINFSQALTYIKKQEFQKTIQKGNPEDLSKDFVQKIDTEMKNADWNLENFSHASSLLRTFADWAEAIINCGKISGQIEPLREEVRGYEKELNKLKEELEEVIKKKEELAKKVVELKESYSETTNQQNEIKKNKEKVEKKVNRSQQLLKNLESEKNRWSLQMEGFSMNTNNVLGDTFLSSAFLAYIGFYDAHYRKYLKEQGRLILDKFSIKYSEKFEEDGWLSKPNDRVAWQTCNLPTDQICFENATILQRFNRYPLIIDPAGQATEFIKKFYESRKLTLTSFTDNNFIKTLEAALRFGYPLLVQDVEKIDPIMNSLLNKEIHKQGGRNLIRIGDQEIDFSSTFNMFMITRDSSCSFTPDLCSKVTFLNFTITESSLTNQILSLLLKSERPEVDKAKEEINVEQRQFHVKIRKLEEELLQALNEGGDIIENDAVMKKLENIKTQSTEINKKLEEADLKIKDFDTTVNEYSPYASISSKIFFALDSLDLISYFYKFSLSFFMDVLQSIIKSSELGKIEKTKYQERKEYIINNLFLEIYHRVGYALLNEDRIIFAMKLAQIKLGDKFNNEIKTLLKATSNILSDPSNINQNILGGKLTLNQRKQISDLIKNEPFTEFYNDLENNEEWNKFIIDGKAEECIPMEFIQNAINKLNNDNDKKMYEQLIKSIILLILRPDRMIGTLTSFLSLVFSDEFMTIPQLNLEKVVKNETYCKTPILFCSAPGQDSSSKIEELAKTMKKKFLSIAIGSAEGFELVEKNFGIKTNNGEWLILKNVHLAPNWLNDLEKKLYACKANENFRLFLTMENNPKIPGNVLRISRKFSFELPSGIRPSLLRSYANVFTSEISEKPPIERCKLHFLLAWFHAVISERLRYAPIGWSKAYEFNESDEKCALLAIDEWIDLHGKDKQNISPDKIPWDAIRKIISQSMYGGKIDNEYDFKILDSIVKMYFNEKTYDFGYPLYKSTKDSQSNVLTVPEGRNNATFIEWVKKLPMIESPEWSGLPSNAEKLVRETATMRFITLINKIQDVEDQDLDDENDSNQGQVSWLKDVQTKSQRLLDNLPEEVITLETTEELANNPIFRFLRREVGVSSKLIKKVRSDLFNIIEMCKGNLKTTNDLREIAKDLFNDQVPKSWKVYNTLDLNVTEWILDLKNRVNQINKVCKLDDYGKNDLWMGGIIFPEAYLTATRQAVAQELKVPLDELLLSVEFPKEIKNISSNSFVLKGLCIEGAEWSYDENKLIMTDNLFSQLPPLILKWTPKSNSDLNKMFPIPVYLNTMRKNLLFSVYIQNGSELTDDDWYQRGIALISWNKSFEYI